MPTRLHAFDLGVVALYLVAITLFGLRFSRSGKAKDKSLRGYFLADRSVPWWAIALSIVSAETSTLTIVSIPGVAFAGDFGFLQVVLGYMLGRVVVAMLFLPRYFRGEMMTAYTLIDRRFGHALHKVTAGLFLLTRAAAEGVRVFAISIVVGIAIGTKDVLSIGIISALTLLYTFEGGMAAVIWTDVVQMTLYVAGTLVALVTLGAHVPGGWAHIHSVAAPLGKFHMLDFSLNLTRSYTFWAGVLGGTFLTMASHGTDQLMVQRMLAAKNLRESRLALLSSGVVVFVQFALFLLIGVGLFVFYGGSMSGFVSADRIFPTFIVREMPRGVAGLLVAAILAAAMSNLSAALNSLSSTTVVDFYMGWRPEADDRERIIVSRTSTVLWALVLFCIAVYSIRVGGRGHVVELGLSIASVAYGCLLGVFLLGTLTKYATQHGAIVGMVFGFALNLTLWMQSIHVWPNPLGGVRFPAVAFTWFVLIGAVLTFGVGSVASLGWGRRAAVAAVVLGMAGSLVAQGGNLGISAGAGIPRVDGKAVEPGAPGPGGVVFGMAGSLVGQGGDLGISGGAGIPRVDGKAVEPGAPGPGEVVLGMAGSLVGQGGNLGISGGAGIPRVDGKAVEPGAPGFGAVSAVIEEAIAAGKLPGAVLVVGHGGKVVFEQAYGLRKLAGEPGVDGKLSAAEPMTVDTIFDMASLTKCLATATAMMQLVEQGKVDVDAPVVKYLPAFGLNGKDKVTVRELLTHYSGLPADVSLKDGWGLKAPDKAEGIRRAMEAKLESEPGTKFVYSDVNYITLGAIVEKVSGEDLDAYAAQHISGPVGMARTQYHAFAKTCGPAEKVGSAVYPGPKPVGRIGMACPRGTWGPYGLDPDTAPTQHDNEGTAETNPDFDRLLRGTVHDPTTRRMGGVAGHAGVFSTAEDMGLFAQALLDRLAGRASDFPLKRETLELMTRPEQPKTAIGGATIFTADGKATTGIAARGFGWDINSAFSRPRGEVFPIGSFGHTGFTGTSVWMDPASDTYVVLLANSVHPRGNPAISLLRGAVATAVGKALGLGGGLTQVSDARPWAPGPWLSGPGIAPATPVKVDCNAPGMNCDPVSSSPPSVETEDAHLTQMVKGTSHVLTGIDVLEATNFVALKDAAARHGGKLRVGLLTNQTGVDAKGQRTIDVLRGVGGGVSLVTLFSPEHGIFGAKDSTEIGQEVDAASGLKVTSLYGPKDTDKRPKPEDLKDLDAIVIDLQDAGVRFYTYETVMGYFLEADACERASGHDLEVMVLDRPALVGGVAVQGPISNTPNSYINYAMRQPVRHGMTLGELAQYFRTKRMTCTIADSKSSVAVTGNAQKTSAVVAAEPAEFDPLDRRRSDTDKIKQTGVWITDQIAHLTVIPMQGWVRAEFFDQTGLTWVNPSPNLRSVGEAILYPGVGMLDATNISVGRGTETPFEVLGAGILTATKDKPAVPQWFDGKTVTAYLTARKIPGVTFAATKYAVAEDSNHYPYHGQTIEGVKMTVTDRLALDSPEMGVEIVSALQHLYPGQFKLTAVKGLVANTEVMAGLERGDDPRVIAAGWAPGLDEFKKRRESYLIYK